MTDSGLGLPPFVVMGLPRSRTFWLSRFLSCGGWECGHEVLRTLRGLDDVRSWLSQPMTGSCETLLAPWWRTLRSECPECRVVVVRRRPEAVLESLMALGVPFDREVLWRQLWRLDRKLDQVTARWPGVLSVGFEELAEEACCATVFEFTLGFPHSPEWWAFHSRMNLQCNFWALVRYCLAFQPQMQRLAGQVRERQLAEFARRRPVPRGDLEISEAPDFRGFLREAEPLLRRHVVEIGEAPEQWTERNWDQLAELADAGAVQTLVGRCNGKMFGYLVTIVAPGIGRSGELQGLGTMFYADEAVPGLGLRLVRRNNEILAERGIHEVDYKTGPKSDPRMSALWRRIGATPHDQIWRMRLAEAE